MQFDVRYFNGTIYYSINSGSVSEIIVNQHPPSNQWLDVIKVGKVFCNLFRPLERPAFIAARQDRWGIADRVRWGELGALDDTAYPTVVRCDDACI
jgi:hypothetical protein